MKLRNIIFDLDQTLVDTKCLESHRKSRSWSLVYKNLGQTTCYDKIQEVLLYCKNNSIKTAIVTSSPASYCNKVIKHYGWEFDTVVGYHDTVNKKPDAAPMLLALARLKCSPNECLSVGDRAIDITASKNAGIKSGACLWGSEERDDLLNSKPDYIFKDVNNLLDFIIKGNLN